MNGEGRTPCDVSKTRDVQRLLEAAERAERHERERRLLTAAKDGRIEDIQELVSELTVGSMSLLMVLLLSMSTTCAMR